MLPTKFDDKSIMPFGKAHKGKALGNVPDAYFVWMLENVTKEAMGLHLWNYLKENEQAIRQNAKLASKNSKR